MLQVLATTLGIEAYSLNDGPRHQVPEEGKGPGGAENKLRLRGLFSQERRSLGPRAEEAWLEHDGAESQLCWIQDPKLVDEGGPLAVGKHIWALCRILGFAFGEASQTGSPN